MLPGLDRRVPPCVCGRTVYETRHRASFQQTALRAAAHLLALRTSPAAGPDTHERCTGLAAGSMLFMLLVAACPGPC